MAEPLTAFVTRRRPDWEALQALLDRQSRNALHLGELRTLDALYRRATSDLALAQAAYPATDAHRFLNQLCGSAYAAIYRPPRDRLVALGRFFRREFPAALRAELRYVGVSAGLMLLGAVVGAVLAGVAPDAARLVVPPELLASIADHHMWTDDAVAIAPNAMSSTIAVNNLTVTIAAFALGITGGLGTAYVLLYNGLLIGAIIPLCVRAGMGYALFSFIGGHGPVELSVIAIAGGGGLILAHALLVPDERPLGEQLSLRARQAIKLILGCAPFLALIAVIEGFVSPGDTFPGWLKIGVGLALGASFWAYLLLAGRGAPTTET